MSEQIIAIGNDHAAFERKKELVAALESWGYTVIDCGAYSSDAVDYPDIAKQTCEKITSGACERAVLLCGTGIGISIAANKIKGIRCAVCSEEFSARMSREHNDSNVLAMGARTIGNELSIAVLKTWLDASFDGAERSRRRVAKIED